MSKIKEFSHEWLPTLLISAGMIVLLFLPFIYKSGNHKELEAVPSSVNIVWRQGHLLLSQENLYNELIAQDIDFPEIVLAQAILETGHFRSYSCKYRNNLFGLRTGSSYMTFDHWTESVAAYKKYIQRYNKLPEDYYTYLQELGYAEDPNYIIKLKQIVK